ncbi:MAG: hypothetical protein H6907_15690 [Hyphomicrobiales bacterium]|nr:hypothetical protein [Hyphomicrobiales bacterium]MCP5373169.1 hypothetical protein [Hyphomicrobiales bacterium]
MTARGEPDLNDLLNDSAIHALMASDDVRHDDLVSLIETARAGLAGRI